jgi:prepilin signal peptidase PulO-like enzyme (type II secretory pathway)
LLIVLLTVATFIDFDEQTIPDWITIPGTLAALFASVVLPNYRLPELVSTLAAVGYQPVTFCSPHDIVQCGWRLDWRGLAAGCGIAILWIAAVIPKIATMRYGIRRGVWLLWVSMIRPHRRRGVLGQSVRRGPFATTWLLLLLGMTICFGTAWVWLLGGDRWDSYLGALLGLGFGGGLVWGVRLIGSAAMGQEAMGFGDVTLMAMIGAFLGWQAALLVFALAPFAALFIAIAQFAFSRSRVIAFGPYLSLAALLLILFWSSVWNDNARSGVFMLGGPILLAVIAGALVAMGLMLLGLRWFKGLRSDNAQGEGVQNE